jgi:SAM-dependent methyltransferase
VDWHAWHSGYDLPRSSLARRLRVVRERIRLALDSCPAGELRVLSVCAGQGRDLLEVLRNHPRRADVTARLIELDPRNAASARATADSARLERIEVVVGDAGLTDQYRGAVPADLVLMCGVFGNLDEEDLERTCGYCSQLCRAGATLVWTQGRGPMPDRVPRICAWLEEGGFERLWLTPPDVGYGVGVHRFAGVCRPLGAGERMFAFIR